MATPAQRTNTWILDEWYDQAVAGTQGEYVGLTNLFQTGNNDNEGWFGINDTINRSSPTQLPGNWKYSMLNTTSDGANGGIKTDGSLWTWGRNEYGEGGRNDRTKRSSPVQLPGTWSVGMMRNRQEGGMGVKTDGSFWVWGQNQQGVLGQNQGPSQLGFISSPVQVPGGDWPLDDQTKLSTAHNHCIYTIKTDGTLWSWGSNTEGSLGQNQSPSSTVGFSSPVQIGTETSWSAIAGADATMALKTDGTLWCWGSNNRGQLGLNQNTGQYAGSYAKSSPTQVGSETTWASISSAQRHSWAVKTNGTLWGWGQNNFGSMGRNLSNPESDGYSSPAQLGTDTNWQAVAAGQDITVALRTDGTVWSWGYDFKGSLGHNESWPTPSGIYGYSSPTQIPGTNWMPGFKTAPNGIALLEQL